MAEVQFYWQEIQSTVLSKSAAEDGHGYSGSLGGKHHKLSKGPRQHLLTLYHMRPEATFKKEPRCLILSCFFTRETNLINIIDVLTK